MQIITDIAEAQTFARNMSQSLADPTYWESWQVIEFSFSPPLDWIKQAKATALVRPQLPDTDGSLLWSEGGLLVICPKTEIGDLSALEENLKKTTGAQEARIAVLGVADRLDEAKEALAKAQGSNPLMAPPPASYQFLKSLVPNIETLLRTWHQGKTNREKREKPHIMIVDDDPMTLRLVGKTLEMNYEVSTAVNGAEAIAKHLQLMPDIILLDIGLPDCDGLTLLNYMQQYDQECRVVMFSADDFLKTKVKAFAGGAKGFLGKPFNLHAFQRQVAAWFSGKEEAN